MKTASISRNFCKKENSYGTFLKCSQCETSLRFLLIAIMANALFSRKFAISRRIYLQITCNILGQFRWFWGHSRSFWVDLENWPEVRSAKIDLTDLKSTDFKHYNTRILIIFKGILRLALGGVPRKCATNVVQKSNMFLECLWLATCFTWFYVKVFVSASMVRMGKCLAFFLRNSM